MKKAKGPQHIKAKNNEQQAGRELPISIQMKGDENKKDNWRRKNAGRDVILRERNSQVMSKNRRNRTKPNKEMQRKGEEKKRKREEVVIIKRKNEKKRKLSIKPQC